MLETIIKALNDKKGENIIAINVSESSPICDYIVICSASNDRQLMTLANSVDQELAKNGYDIKKIEGKGSKWLIVDAKSIVVHLFTKEEREEYNIEKLFEKFPLVDIASYLE